jgi:hypothetical protein
MWPILTKWFAKRRQTQPEINPEKTRQPNIVAEQVHLHWHINDMTQVPGQLTWNSRLDGLTMPVSQPFAPKAVYDERLLERATMQWQFGDWDSLASMEEHAIQHHHDRAKLASPNGLCHHFLRPAPHFSSTYNNDFLINEYISSITFESC